jgi:uncharacterized protein
MRIITIIAVLAISCQVSGQTPAELRLLGARTSEKQEALCRDHHEKFEVTGTLDMAFYVYKTFISSQDHMSCVFTPSCSEYAVEAVRRQGMLIGLINTFDRLTRCNGLRAKDYPVDQVSQRLHDPVKNIRHEAP